MVLVEALLLLALLIVIAAFIAVWWTGRSRKKRGQRMVAGLVHIQDLTTQMYESRDRSMCDPINQLIDSWNAEYSAEVGRSMSRIDCSTV